MFLFLPLRPPNCRPEIFKSTVSDEPCGSLKGHTSKQEETENEHDSSDDDGLPPLEANMNRMRPSEWQSDAESDSDSDSDSEKPNLE